MKEAWFNPIIDQAIVDEALAEDPEAASAEWLGEFRNDIAAYVSREVVEALVTPNCFERPPISTISYRAFVDPSGGSSDAMTLAIAHTEDGRVILDAVRERKPPFSPDAVVTDFCDLLDTYRVRSVTGDRYAGEFAREPFRKRGVEYLVADKPRSDLYRDMLPKLNSGVVDLLDHKRLITQIVNLERRVARGGRESIDHSPGNHDDIANSVAGVIDLLANKPHASFAAVDTGFY